MLQRSCRCVLVVLWEPLPCPGYFFEALVWIRQNISVYSGKTILPSKTAFDQYLFISLLLLSVNRFKEIKVEHFSIKETANHVQKKDFTRE